MSTKTFSGTVIRTEHYRYTVDADTQEEAEAKIWDLFDDEGNDCSDAENNLQDVVEVVAEGSAK